MSRRTGFLESGLNLTGADPHATGLPVLELRGVHKSFGASEIIHDVHLALRSGERVGLIGPNGAGKSTLFNLISGELAPSRGSIWLHGRRIDGLPPHLIYRRGLARSFQISQLFGRMTVLDHLRTALLWPLGHRMAWWKRLPGLPDVQRRAEHLLKDLQLQDRRDTPAAELSYAEQRALDIGLAIAGDADVLLLDEPTAGMNRSETAHFVQLVRSVSAGRTLLIVEHDMGVVFELADRVAVLVQGELVAFDEPAVVRADPRVRRAYLGDPTPSGSADAWSEVPPC